VGEIMWLVVGYETEKKIPLNYIGGGIQAMSRKQNFIEN